mmetsp:Transcript_6711/g.16301  ORF Transcript_6711/g.16301 Transcript_6711/m.16301 type:complete len:552 (+) Transcript_6711:1193-2848(+)
MALQLLYRNLSQLLNLLVCDLVPLVEEVEDAHLVGRAVEVVAGLGQRRLDVSGAQIVLPCEPPSGVLAQVVGLEVVTLVRDFSWHVDDEVAGIRPVARRQDVHLQLNTRSPRTLPLRPAYPAVVLHEVVRQADVREHALQLGRIQVTAFGLELLDHLLLGLLGEAALVEQTLRQMLFVVVFEDVLVLQESEDGDDLLQLGLNVRIRQTLHSLLEELVNVEREELCSAGVLVDETLERRLEAGLELLGLAEGLLDKRVVLLLEVEQGVDEHDRLLNPLGILQNLLTSVYDAFPHDLPHLDKRVGDALEQLKQTLQILLLVIVEHGSATRVLSVHECLVVLLDPLSVHDGHDLVEAARVQVVVYTLRLLAYARLSLLEVVGHAVLRDVSLRLESVEALRLSQVEVLKVVLVNRARLHAEFDEHLDGVLHEDAIDLLAVTLILDVLEQDGQQPVLDTTMARHLFSEEVQAEVEYGDLSVLSDEVAVHVHENVADHDHRRAVVLPLVLQLVQQLVVGCADDSIGDLFEVLLDGVLHTLVQQLTVLVQHQTIRIPV